MSKGNGQPPTETSISKQDLDQVVEAVEEIIKTNAKTGAAISNLIMGFQNWKQRRRTRIRVISGSTAEYEVTFDFVLPKSLLYLDFSQLTSPKTTTSSEMLVPLTFLRKGPTPRLNVCGADGTELAHLPKDDNAILSTLFLSELALRILADKSNQRNVIRDCATIVLTDENQEVSDANQPARVANIINKYLVGGDREALNLFDFFARQLEQSFLLFVAIDASGPVRRLVKLRYLGDFTFGRRNNGNPVRRALRNIFSAGSYSFDDVVVPGLADARSTHVEIALPNSVISKKVRVTLQSDDEPSAKISIKDNVIHVVWHKVSFASRYTIGFTVELTNYLGTPPLSSIAVLLLFLASLFVFLVSGGTSKLYANEIFKIVPLLLVIPTSLGLFVKNDSEDHMLDIVQRPIRAVGFLTVFFQIFLAALVPILSRSTNHRIAILFMIISGLFLIPLVRLPFILLGTALTSTNRHN